MPFDVGPCRGVGGSDEIDVDDNDGAIGILSSNLTLEAMLDDVVVDKGSKSSYDCVRGYKHPTEAWRCLTKSCGSSASYIEYECTFPVGLTAGDDPSPPLPPS